MNTLKIGRLYGGGLVLGYRCSSKCRHCLYGCGPHRTDGGLQTKEQADNILNTMKNYAPLAPWHIGGGEPFLNTENLKYIIKGMKSRNLILEYVETNAHWAKDKENTTLTLKELKDAGLNCVLVSVSPFHAEFIKPSYTYNLIESAQKILPNGAFIWVPAFLKTLQEISPDSKLNLIAKIKLLGSSYARQIVQQYSLIPAARAGRFIYKYGNIKYNYKEFTDNNYCITRLTDTSHFHLDCDSLYVPGLCAGIAFLVTKIFKPLELSEFPLIKQLVKGGPSELAKFAIAKGFEPNEYYSSACDLCTHVRQFLYQFNYSELGPSGFYDLKSVTGY